MKRYLVQIETHFKIVERRPGKWASVPFKETVSRGLVVGRSVWGFTVIRYADSRWPRFAIRYPLMGSRRHGEASR